MFPPGQRLRAFSESKHSWLSFNMRILARTKAVGTVPSGPGRGKGSLNHNQQQIHGFLAKLHEPMRLHIFVLTEKD